MDKQYLEVYCTGMAQGTPSEPCVVVILGVAGDLGRTTLIPSLYALSAQGLLPDPVGIIGVARRDWDDETLRQEMRPYVEDTKRFREDRWITFARHLHYAKVDFSASPEADYAIRLPHAG
jgi:glucose-6-phosphate 1-dehydrogenase